MQCILLCQFSPMDIWHRPDVKRALKAVLDYLTCDSWNFEFIEAKEQIPVNLSKDISGTADLKHLYSLIARGLIREQLLVWKNNSNSDPICAWQKIILEKEIPSALFYRNSFQCRQYYSNESSFRSRGFQFAAVTAIAAHMRNLSRIVVPESGQGALGPAMLPLHMLYPIIEIIQASFERWKSWFRHCLIIKSNMNSRAYGSPKDRLLPNLPHYHLRTKTVF